jgi:hypothetical protein
MHVLLYGTYNATLSTAVAEGIHSLGHKVTFRNQNVYRAGEVEPGDVAVIMGLHGGGWYILQDQRKRGAPVLVIDYGYVKRGTAMGGSNISLDRYYSISLNGLNGRSDPLPSPMPSDRWDSLGLPLQPWRGQEKFVLVCGQKTNDAAIGDLNPRLWAAQTIEQVQMYTRKTVMFRPHPEDPSQRRPIGVPHSTHETFIEALADVHAVVAYNSNALVEATIAGVPTFALGEGSMVQGVTNTELRDLDKPLAFAREQWAYDLAWRQYTVEEFRSGLPWLYAIDRNVETVSEMCRVLEREEPREDATHHDQRRRTRSARPRPSSDDPGEHPLSLG